MVEELRCARCRSRACREGKDCFAVAARHAPSYEGGEDARLHRAASAIEARHYGEATRLAETILFARELGCRKVGLVFCVGLADEARAIEEILSKDFEVLSVCCKVGGLAKEDFGLERIRDDAPTEVLCNSVGQAELCNEGGTELNILCGLCVGHDAVFTRRSRAPVTTLVAKDRVLAHNPVAAVTCPYVRKRLQSL